MTESFLLRQKNNPVALMLLGIDDDDIEWNNVSIINSERLPFLNDKNGGLKEWIQDRSIPDGRTHLEELLQEAGCSSSQQLLIKNLALSLSDTYWLCPASLEKLSWEQINLYQHGGERLTFHDGAGRAYYTSSDSSLTGQGCFTKSNSVFRVYSDDKEIAR